MAVLMCMCVDITDEMEHRSPEPVSRPLVAVADDDDEARSEDEMDSTSEHSDDDQQQQQQMVIRDTTSDKSHG